MKSKQSSVGGGAKQRELSLKTPRSNQFDSPRVISMMRENCKQEEIEWEERIQMILNPEETFDTRKRTNLANEKESKVNEIELQEGLLDKRQESNPHQS